MSVDSASVADRFTAADFARIVESTFVDRVDFHDEIDSTNLRAAALTAGESPSERSTVLVLADHQTAGRGRGSNTWWSTPGGLTFSVLLRPDALELPTSRWPQLSLTAGLAVCEAIERLSPALAPQIKWPNDVFVSGRKICGILIEAATGKQSCIILGIGLNVNNSANTAPPELGERVVALSDVVEAPLRRADVLLGVLEQLTLAVGRLATNAADIHGEFSKRSLLTGRTVEIELPSGQLAGRCQGIDADGALLVETSAGVERCLSGVVVHWD
jgi:BirA family transcriptional regulator, biotin operon repressor / biotin---[acetyl-CoA-carboxylase] ligase